jgi:uncharacterized OB-fold protein
MSNSSGAGKAMDWSRGVVLRAGDKSLGLYQPSPETTGYWQGVERRELLLKVCLDCKTLHHPRRIVCSACASTNLSWKRSSGEGVVYTFSEIHRTAGVFGASVPYVVGIVKLKEGVYLFSRIIPAAQRKVAIDVPVSVDFRVLEEGYLLPVFVVRGN